LEISIKPIRLKQRQSIFFIDFTVSFKALQFIAHNVLQYETVGISGSVCIHRGKRRSGNQTIANH